MTIEARERLNQLQTEAATRIVVGLEAGDPAFVDPWEDVCEAFAGDDLERMLGVLPRALTWCLQLYPPEAVVSAPKDGGVDLPSLLRGTVAIATLAADVLQMSRDPSAEVHASRHRSVADLAGAWVP